MFRTRVSIAGLMWAVCLSAVGLAALKSGSDAWSGSIFLLTCGTLAVGVVGIACDALAGDGGSASRCSDWGTCTWRSGFDWNGSSSRRWPRTG